MKTQIIDLSAVWFQRSISHYFVALHDALDGGSACLDGGNVPNAAIGRIKDEFA